MKTKKRALRLLVAAALIFAGAPVSAAFAGGVVCVPNVSITDPAGCAYVHAHGGSTSNGNSSSGSSSSSGSGSSSSSSNTGGNTFSDGSRTTSPPPPTSPYSGSPYYVNSNPVTLTINGQTLTVTGQDFSSQPATVYGSGGTHTAVSTSSLTQAQLAALKQNGFKTSGGYVLMSTGASHPATWQSYHQSYNQSHPFTGQSTGEITWLGNYTGGLSSSSSGSSANTSPSGGSSSGTPPPVRVTYSASPVSITGMTFSPETVKAGSATTLSVTTSGPACSVKAVGPKGTSTQLKKASSSTWKTTLTPPAPPRNTEVQTDTYTAYASGCSGQGTTGTQGVIVWHLLSGSATQNCQSACTAPGSLTPSSGGSSGTPGSGSGANTTTGSGSGKTVLTNP